MFKSKIFLMSFAAVLGSTLIGLMLSTNTDAANPEPVSVDVEFIAPITIGENNALQFGLVDVNLAGGDTITIAPDDSVSESTPRIVGGTQLAADLTVTATAGRAITILVDNVSNGTGYTLGTWRCHYDGPDGDCDGGGLSETSVASVNLEVGVTLTGNGSAAAGVDNGGFDVTITYD